MATAKELIKAKQQNGRDLTLSAEAKRELQEIVAYNDRCGSCSQRVACDLVIKMLQEYGWQGRTRRDLEKVCTEALGRTGYGRA